MANYTGYIYSVTNEINGKSYIGKTNNLVRRWKEHCYGSGNTSILNRAIKKYGLEHFVFDIVAQIPFDSIEELNDVLKQLEIYYISLYDTFKNGYNATIGGDGTSCYHHSEETKKKISKSNTGKILSETHKEKCRVANLGNHHSEKAKKAIKQALLNRDHSIYEKVAEKLRGKKRERNMIMKAAAKRRKPILQYSLEGKFLNEYDGATCVNIKWETNIVACCAGKLSSAYGFLWKYKTVDNYPIQIDIPANFHVSNRPIIQCDKNGKVIDEFKSTTVASIITSINRKAISNCLRGRSKSAGNYVWKYKNIGGAQDE